EEIERMVEQSCSAKASDVRMVVKELFDSIRHYMQAGYVVKLGDLGRFYISVKSVCVDDPKAFNIRRHITRIVCGFLPSGRRTQGRHILYDLCDGVKAIWHNGAKP
ncbi:MAG: hypothetical protein IIT76_12240, partial [Prevotella sp.]|nr:hypothetical protein [Prevotella sp.]